MRPALLRQQAGLPARPIGCLVIGLLLALALGLPMFASTSQDGLIVVLPRSCRIQGIFRGVESSRDRILSVNNSPKIESIE